MQGIRRRRLLNDFQDIRENYHWVRAQFQELSDWQVDIEYKGKCLQMELHFPDEFPQLPPCCVLESIVFHPNIWPNGRICLDVLSSSWVSATSIGSVIVYIIQLLENPNATSPANVEAANMLQSHPDAYEQRFEAAIEELPLFQRE